MYIIVDGWVTCIILANSVACMYFVSGFSLEAGVGQGSLVTTSSMRGAAMSLDAAIAGGRKEGGGNETRRRSPKLTHPS